MTPAVTGVRPLRGAVELTLAGGGRIACDRVVLATGGLAQAAPCELPDDPRVLRDPWAADAARRGSGPDERGEPHGVTLIVGTGLTAVDVALAACARSPHARAVAVSRHGRLPYAHLPGVRRAAPAPDLGAGRLRLGALEHAVRAHVADGRARRRPCERRPARPGAARDVRGRAARPRRPGRRPRVGARCAAARRAVGVDRRPRAARPGRGCRPCRVGVRRGAHGGARVMRPACPPATMTA
jgi:hypothetical protein